MSRMWTSTCSPPTITAFWSEFTAPDGWRCDGEPTMKSALDISRGGPYVYQLMDATPVRDPAGTVDELITDARERFASFSHSAATIKDMHFRVGEARMKLRSAIRTENTGLQAYLCGIYTELLLDAVFVMVNKPVARGTTAWRWLHQLPGLTPEGLAHLTELFSATAGRPGAYDGGVSESAARSLDRQIEALNDDGQLYTTRAVSV